MGTFPELRIRARVDVLNRAQQLLEQRPRASFAIRVPSGPAC